MCLGFPFIASLLEPTPKASSLKFPRWFIHHSWGCLKLFGEAKMNLRFLFGYLSSVDGSDFSSVDGSDVASSNRMNTLGICPNMKWRKISFISNARFHATWKKKISSLKSNDEGGQCSLFLFIFRVSNISRSVRHVSEALRLHDITHGESVSPRCLSVVVMNHL